MKKIICIICWLLFLPVLAFADTHTADSCSIADITTAYTAASAGDTVAFSGECTWAGTLTLQKAITLDGTGATITHNNGTTPYANALISISPTTATDFIRVTGIYFENTNYVGTSRVDITIGTNATNFRIDHCTFHNGKEAIGWYLKRANGVIDANEFIDVDLAIRTNDLADYYNSSPSTSSWGRTIAMGAADAVFIENNTFTVTNQASCNQLNESLYSANAARTVFRYNAINNACALSIDTTLDAHGLGGTDRGTVLLEAYNNSFNFINIAYWTHLRGGTILFYNNIMTSSSSTPTIRLRNELEEDWAYGNDDEWPSMDQHYNSFFWNNTVNGSAATFTIQGDFIRENYEYFKHAPQSSGGKSSFPGSPGMSNDFCTGSGTATLTQGGTSSHACCTGSGTGTCDMTFSADGANAYYPYTAYTCPHPTTGITGKVCDAATAGKTGYGVDEGATQYTLTVTLAGTGVGAVTSSPAGIDCGATCTYDYDEDTEVTLTATPTGSDVFAGWSGTGGCTGTSTCVLTMTAAKAATATFNLPAVVTAVMTGGVVSGGTIK